MLRVRSVPLNVQLISCIHRKSAVTQHAGIDRQYLPCSIEIIEATVETCIDSVPSPGCQREIHRFNGSTSTQINILTLRYRQSFTACQINPRSSNRPIQHAAIF